VIISNIFISNLKKKYPVYETMDMLPFKVCILTKIVGSTEYEPLPKFNKKNTSPDRTNSLSSITQGDRHV